MPFQSNADVELFRYVNEKDPLGEKGLTPRSWNLEPDPENTGKFRLMQPDTPGESVWKFVRYRTQADDDIIVRKTAKTRIRYDSKKARKQGRDYSPEFDQETLMSGLMSLITTMSRGWVGREFVVPEGWADQNGQPSSYNGKLAPCNAFWIGQRDPVELRALELWLQELYEPEGGEEDEQSIIEFQEAVPGMDGPTGAGFDETNDGQPDGVVSISA